MMKKLSSVNYILLQLGEVELNFSLNVCYFLPRKAGDQSQLLQCLSFMHWPGF